MNKINQYQKLITAYFLATTLFWLYLAVINQQTGLANFWFSFLFGLTPLVGGLIGMLKASIWGGLSSALGRAIFFVSLGLVLWGVGESIWSYYNFFRHVAAPYPSLADLGFAPSIFFWVLGTAFLSKATGAMFALRKSHWAKLFAIVAPLVLLIPSYYIEIKLARGGTLIPAGETEIKTILDIAYPFGDFLAVTFAAVVFSLSYKYFGGRYRMAVSSLLVGLTLMYIGDSVFSYTTTKSTYYNADWGDMLLNFGLFAITFGILAFATKPASKLSEKTKA